MKLTVTTFVSVDGVYQGPGGPDEDRSGGFDRGGWVAPLFDEGCGQFINEVFERADGFLLGRRTYEIFASFWPNVTDPNDPSAPVASRLNNLPKYVASGSLTSADWQNSSLIREVPTEVARLKEQHGGELQVHGSGELARSLLQHDLVDEWNLMIFPVIVGAGRRLFPESGVDAGLKLVNSRTTQNGVTIQVYQPTGRASFGSIV